MKAIKKLKKLGLYLFALMLLVTSIMPISALENDTISFDVPSVGIIIETEYSLADYRLEETTSDKTIIYSIIDSCNEVIETWEFDDADKIMLRNGTMNMSYTNRKSVGAMSGSLVNIVNLNLYRYGSFGQFNNLNYTTQYVEGWSYFKLGSVGIVVRPPNNTYPATRVNVNYDIPVTATLNASLNLRYKGTLINAGFTVGGSYHYTKRISNNYNILAMNGG